MKKLLVLLLIAFVLFSATGCLKVRKVIQERTDQTVSGNQGVIYEKTDQPEGSGEIHPFRGAYRAFGIFNNPLCDGLCAGSDPSGR